MLANDTHDSSTIKATHFKEDEAGDLKEVPDMKRNTDPLPHHHHHHHPPLRQEKQSGERKPCSKCVYVVCRLVFTRSSDSERQELKTVCGGRGGEGGRRGF